MLNREKQYEHYQKKSQLIINSKSFFLTTLEQLGVICIAILWKTMRADDTFSHVQCDPLLLIWQSSSLDVGWFFPSNCASVWYCVSFFLPALAKPGNSPITEPDQQPTTTTPPPPPPADHFISSIVSFFQSSQVLNHTHTLEKWVFSGWRWHSSTISRA